MSIDVQTQPRRSFLERIFGIPVNPEPVPMPEVVTVPSRENQPKPGGLLAAARRLTGKDVAGRNKGAQGGASDVAAWQEEAWDLLDLIGEQRFLANTLAGRMSQATLYVGKIDPTASPGTRPEHVEEERVQSVLYAIGDGPTGLGQILHRCGVNLFVAGEGWLIGIPPRLVPGTPEHRAATDLAGQQRIVDRTPVAQAEETDADVLSLAWRMFSVSEVNVDQSSQASLKMEGGETITAPVDDLYMVRVWRPHPRRAWEADSPTRASLPVLRELLGLTMHVSAQIDSRLAGAGLLLFSASADAQLKRAAGLPENEPGSPLMDAIIEAATTAIKDRSNASALVPIVVTVPDEAVDKIKHVTFSTPLDKETPKLRDEAIRRLALGQDAPPELLLGTGGMNHWGAWLVREDVVQTHLEPPLALICDALTTQYLRPVLIGMGMSPEEAGQHVVWYDVDNLIERPNRGGDAKDLFAAGVINAKALREANGFEEGDAPEQTATIDPVVQMAVDAVIAAPSLFQGVGLPEIVRQLREVIGGNPGEGDAAPVATEPVESSEGDNTSGQIPDTQADPPPAGTPGNPDGGAA